jgi:hypothetical protein
MCFLALEYDMKPHIEVAIVDRAVVLFRQYSAVKGVDSGNTGKILVAFIDK